MRLFTIFLLVAGIFFFHSAGTIDLFIGKIVVQTVMSAEEEEEEEETQEKQDASYCGSLFVFQVVEGNSLAGKKYAYSEFPGSLDVVYRIEMPPEL